MSDNTTVTGNLVKDVELRYTPSGQGTASFGIAVNRRWQDKSGNWQEKASFFDVSCWGTLAENCAESLTKGDRVVVTGRLEQRSWEDQDRQKHYKIEIVADEVAPSLRWATAEVRKNERTGPGPATTGPRGSGFKSDDPPPPDDGPF